MQNVWQIVYILSLELIAIISWWSLSWDFLCWVYDQVHLIVASDCLEEVVDPYMTVLRMHPWIFLFASHGYLYLCFGHIIWGCLFSLLNLWLYTWPKLKPDLLLNIGVNFLCLHWKGKLNGNRFCWYNMRSAYSLSVYYFYVGVFYWTRGYYSVSFVHLIVSLILW